MPIQFQKTLITPNNLSMMEQDIAKSARQNRPNIATLAENLKENTGVVTQHLISLQQVAHDHNCIIGIRPVDKMATGLIEESHPTKGFHIKGKSASWGPQAGLICVDQRYSKLENTPDQIEKFNYQTQQCIKDGYAVAVPLVISANRLHALQEAGLIGERSRENTQGVITFSAKAPSGQIYQFEGTRKGQDFVITSNGEPITVLAPKADAKAFTADYDLLVISPHISDVGSQDNLLVPDVSHNVFRSKINQYRGIPSNVYLLNDYLNAKSFHAKEDADLGNASMRVRNMIPVINQALVGVGEAVVHHSTDSGSPATDIKAN
ncbi:anthrax toxin-like adenylyl cyclase domain-containing protein [Chitinimonas sp. PSY-7]|uniref:anthrax toxin-like adenylyl cyclase domain-containing protein n=1 Tax=Chitinimonas sp. PSY-7 TaxID=3459088 RepID=UPI0040402A86